MASKKKLINFCSSSNLNTSDRLPPNSELKSSSSVDGKEIKLFYDSLVSDLPNQVPSSNCRIDSSVLSRKSKPQPHESDTEKTNTNFLKLCQNNEKSKVATFLKSAPKFNLNYCDMYGWTPLMCAACSGAVEIVKILLTNGAKICIKESTGRTAFDIAQQVEQNAVCWELKSFCNSKTAKRATRTTAKTAVPSLCKFCNFKFQDEEEHMKSIIHKLNQPSSSSSSITHYHIPDSNVGYQLMLKRGWNPEKGLGSEGNEGNKYPIKTVFKNDKLGLGVKTMSKPRITHSVFDIKSVGHSRRVKTKKMIMRKLQDDKHLERFYRDELR